jgi:hypothetical protein
VFRVGGEYNIIKGSNSGEDGIVYDIKRWTTASAWNSPRSFSRLAVSA